MSKQKQKLVFIQVIQWLFLSILISIPWILSLDYSILYNIVTCVALIPFLKLFRSPVPITISGDYKEVVFYDIKRNHFNPGPKRTIVFYKWFLVWIPVFKREYTFSTNEGFSNVIRDCYDDFRKGVSLPNRIDRDRSLERRVREFKKIKERIYI